MKNLFKSMMLVAVAAMGFTACSKEAVEEVNPAIEKGFSLTISAEKPALESDTRTEFADGSVIWTANDQIRACYYHSTGTWSKYYASTSSTVAADGSTATFTEFNPSNNAGIPLVDAAGTYTFYAGYPSKSGTIGSGTNAPTDGVLSVKVATEQTMSKAGTFDAAADIMVGKATETISGIEDGVNLDLSFNYTRLVAHGCVTLKNFAAEEGEKVLNVTFTAPADVMLTGSGSVNFVEQTMTALNNNTVTVTLPENTAANENVVVWFCSAPATIASGANLTVTVETTRGTYTRTITANANGIQFLQNRYNTLGINMSSAEFVAATVESLKVTGATTAFTTEDDFVFDGTVTATLSNGYEQDVTALATVDSSEVDMTTAGTYTVTVSYGGKETSYEVTVQDASVQTQEVTITFDGVAGQKDGLTWESDPITVVANTASGSNAPYEHADEHLRFYTNNTLTFSGATITKIVFNLVSGRTEGLSTDVGNYSLSSTTGTWVGSAKSVTFTTTSQARIKSVTITYLGAGGGGEEPDPTPDPGTGDEPGTGEEVTVSLSQAAIYNQNPGSQKTDYNTTYNIESDNYTWICKSQYSYQSKAYNSWWFLGLNSGKSAYIKIPEMPGAIKKIVFAVTNGSYYITGGEAAPYTFNGCGCDKTIYFSDDQAASNKIGSVKGDGTTNYIEIDLSSNTEHKTGYITTSGFVRIWSIDVTYAN